MDGLLFHTIPLSRSISFAQMTTLNETMASDVEKLQSEFLTKMTAINESFASEVEALRSEELGEAMEMVRSNGDQLQRLSERMNNSKLTPEIRDLMTIHRRRTGKPLMSLDLLPPVFVFSFQRSRRDGEHH